MGDAARAGAINRALTHGTGPRMPRMPYAEIQTIITRMKRKKRRQKGGNARARDAVFSPGMPGMAWRMPTKGKFKKRRQQGGSVPKGYRNYRTRRIRQQGGIVKRQNNLNNVPVHYQYYQ